MAETDDGYLSIGEVLGLLADEFPEVTISKIRFLESQGLINPERTTSGFRKFHELDVELLRVILREQRENYLPLRIIKDRINTGEIDPSSEISRPKGIDRPEATQEIADPGSHPSARRRRTTSPETTAVTTADVVGFGTGLHLDRGEFRSMTGLTERELTELESFGIVSRRRASSSTYVEQEVAIGVASRILLRFGIDARHLRTWRTSAEKELSLIEQLLAHQLRQRDPSVRRKTNEQSEEIAEAGGKLRAALVQEGLQRLFE